SSRGIKEGSKPPPVRLRRWVCCTLGTCRGARVRDHLPAGSRPLGHHQPGGPRQPGDRQAAVVISTDNLGKRFGRTLAVSGVSLGVGEGEIFGFLGPNGAGKTTTIRLLLGFLRPSAGRATVLGCDAWREAARVHEQVGYLPGDARLYDFMTGTGFLTMMARLRGQRDISAGRALAERLGLDLSPRIKTYSRGTRQKLGLVQAL